MTAPPLLSGMKVLELAPWRPAPHAGMILAQLGATVVKVERPGGDPMRQFPELFSDLCRGKRSVVADLSTPEGRRLALDLVAQAGVVLEGWRPGVADRLGVGYRAVAEINPAVVYCSVSGYGQTGPLRDASGHDLNYQAISGALSSRRGGEEPPEVPTYPWADILSGTAAALFVCAAHGRAQTSGEGEYIDLAMADVLTAWLGPDTGVAMAGEAGRVRESAGYGVFAAADGRALALGVVAEDHFWRALCTELDMDDGAALTYPQRRAEAGHLNAQIAERLAGMDRDDACARLSAVGVPASPVLSRAEALDHDQPRERGVVAGRAGEAGPVELELPARLEVHPPGPAGPVPRLGQHQTAGFGPLT